MNITSNPSYSSYVYNPYADSPFNQQSSPASISSPDQFNTQIESGIVNSMITADSSLNSSNQNTSWLNLFGQLSSMTTDEYVYMNNNLATLTSGQNSLYTTNLMQASYMQANQLMSNTSRGQLINQTA